MDIQAKPFSLVSIDPLGSISCHPTKGSRNTVKLYHLMIVCRSTGATQVYLMEGSETSDIILALLRLENCFGTTLKMIIVDASTNLLEQNVNPEIKRELWEEKGKEKKRLFASMTTVAHPVNSQFRNYCERNTSIIKKWMRQATMIGRKVTFPVLNRVEWEYILEMEWNAYSC